MPAGYCDFRGCTEIASIDNRQCHACLSSYCPDHLLTPNDSHPCPSSWRLNQEVVRVIEGDVAAAAEDQRPGVGFSFDWVPGREKSGPSARMTGAFHTHAALTFADGVQWLARLRSQYLTPLDKKTADALTACDAATMRTAHELALDFVPRVHLPIGYDPRSLPFFFVDMINAKHLPLDAPESVYAKVTKQIAQFMIQMSTKSFSGIGSLCFDDKGEVVVGPLHVSHFYAFRAANLGTYRTSAELKLAQLGHVMRLVREGKMWWDWRWRREVCDPIWPYIMFLEARDIILACEELHVEQPTYLRHGDDHAGQFLVDDEQHLVGVLDWEFSGTLPFSEAFVGPRWLHDRPVGRHGQDSHTNELSSHAKALVCELVQLGHQDLADAVTQGRKYYPLEAVLGGGVPKYEGAVGLRLAWFPDTSVPSSKEEWIAAAMLKYGDDDGLKGIVERWKVYKAQNEEAFNADVKLEKEAAASQKEKARERKERRDAKARARANGNTAIL